MIAALYATGIRPGDRFFCPSSAAWGHGLWHGTPGPLTLGITTGTISGKFDPHRFARALSEYEITARRPRPLISHAQEQRCASHHQHQRNCPIRANRLTQRPPNSSRRFWDDPCSMYGTTEVGTVWSTIQVPKILTCNVALWKTHTWNRGRRSQQ